MTLLAFLVMLLVSLATLTRVETQVAFNSQALVQARQNALLALNIAIGRLAETAGYDRRVTAAGDLTTVAQAKNPYWTGVWDAATAGAVPAWLVSGDTVNAATDLASSANAVQLVGSNTTGSVATRYVYASKQDIAVSNIPGIAGSKTVGKIAYWVGDEGVKGNLALTDPTRAAADQPLPVDAAGPVADASQRERVGRLIAARGGPDSMTGLGLAPEFESEGVTAERLRWSSLSKIVSRAQMQYSLADTTARKNLVRDAFHGITSYSFGVLSNTAAGGLKRNLIYSPDASDAFIQDLNTPRVTAAAPSVTSVAGAAAVGTPAAAPKPIITEIAFDFIPFRQDSPGGIASAPVRIGYRLRMEFWNPYPFPLKQATAVGADDYKVRVTGLPKLTFSAPLQPTQPTNAEFDLATMITPTTDIIVELDTDLAAGGFVRRSQNPVVLGNQASGLTNVMVLDSTPTAAAAALTNDRLSYSWPAGKITYEIYRNDGSSKPLMVIRDVPYKAGSRSPNTPWYIVSNNAFPGTTFTSTTNMGRGITFHAAIDESLIADISDWVNPPPAHLASSGAYPMDFRASDVTWDNEYFDAAGDTPADSADQPLAIFPNTGYFQLGNPVVVSDISAQAQLSLGQAAFVGFTGARPFAVGNPWGGALNDLFDRGFLLPVSASWTSGQLLTNPRYYPAHGGVAAADLRKVDAGKQLLVAGMFNVNSTSATAWEVFLGRSNRITTGGSLNGTTVRNPVFAFPNSADLITTAAVPSVDNRGTAGLTQDQLSDLAMRIASNIRAKGKPFVSVAEFLNSGVVADAITANATSAAGAAKINGSSIKAYRSNFLTQAVLLNALQPFISVRSDTFLVRAYGESINPVTDAVMGRSYVEAVVQRMPDLVGTGDVMADTVAGQFGRRFSVSAFRWLNSSDL